MTSESTTSEVDVSRPPLPHARTEPKLMVVGIGGSAGALGALLTLLESVKDDFAAAVVVVLHLSPDHESSAVEILQRVTHLRVSQVRARTLLEAGHVYVIAPGMNLITEDGHVQPSEGSPKRPSTVIDLFFRSLAQVHGERAVGIVLSGTGQDGMLGLAHIKERGGFTIVQSPEEAEYSEMPQAAIARRSVDLILQSADIGNRLADLAKLPRLIATDLREATDQKDAAADEQSDQRAFQDILNTVRIFTRHDFRQYKRPTILRRIERRMLVNRLTSIQTYRNFVRSHPEEHAPLLSDLLISVTNFFRDPRAFETLRDQVIPTLMDNVAPGEDLRCWVPACASGEESYSLAILLHEYAAQMVQPPRVQIFASDINDATLALARTGTYPLNIAADVSDAHLLRYFEKEEGAHYRVRPIIREMILFAAHNVLADPPFSRLDLICCRNLLIYLDRAGQTAVLDMLAYALNPGGYLFLGNAESIDAANTPFETVSKEHRIYRLRPGTEVAIRPRIPPHLYGKTATPIQVQSSAMHIAQDRPLAVVHEQALAAASPPNVMINALHEIERVSPGAGRFVTFGEGVPTRSLLNNVAADIRVELRAALYRADESGERVKTVFRRANQDGKSPGVALALSVYPVKGDDGKAARFVVFFEEQPSDAEVAPSEDADGRAPYQAVVQRLEAENRALKLHLQETLDRSAISNEELKASNEELQAINEELRSAKEELETSKEEIQSANEELTTVNFELRSKVDEAVRNNDDLRNFIDSSNVATVFVDPGMRVKRFTPEASKLFSLIPSDVGRSLMDVKSRLQYAEIVDDALSVFKQLKPVERTIMSIDQEHYLARVLPYRTSYDNIGGAVLTFINITELRRAQDRVRTTEERLRDAIAASKDFAVISADADGNIISWNEGAERMFGYASAEVTGKPVDFLYTREDVARDVPAEERRTAARNGRAADERWYVRKDGETVYCSGVLTPIYGATGLGYLKIARDVSDRKAREVHNRNELGNERRHTALNSAVWRPPT